MGGYFQTPDGTHISVPPIARASLACVYESLIEAENEDEAFAKGYLALSLSENETVTEKEIVADGELYRVKISYTAIVKMNT